MLSSSVICQRGQQRTCAAVARVHFRTAGVLFCPWYHLQEEIMQLLTSGPYAENVVSVKPEASNELFDLGPFASLIAVGR